jgi:formate dehydrogenase maturation protein FdhE
MGVLTRRMFPLTKQSYVEAVRYYCSECNTTVTLIVKTELLEEAEKDGRIRIERLGICNSFIK